MDRLKWITVLLVSAMVGLLLLQGYWIQQNYELRDQEYRRAVKKSLGDVAQKIEHFRVGESIKRKYSRRHRVSDTVFYAPNGGRVQIHIEGHVDEMPQAPEDLFQEDLAQLDPNGGAQTLQEFMDELRVSIDGPKWEIFDEKHLDSLLKSALEENGVSPKFAFRTYDRNSKVRIESPEFEEISKHAVVYKIPILRSQFLGNHRGMLFVGFPKLKSEVFFTMWPQFLLSIGLVLVLIYVFYTVLNTVYRQKRLSQVKTDFINNMTHELRTPISTIRLAAEALTQTNVVVPPVMTDKYLNMIGAEGKRLTLLVDEVLNTAQLDKGGFKLSREWFSWENLKTSIEQKFGLITSDKEGELVFQGEWEGKYFGDLLHITNALSNLVDNALKYGGQPPKVVLTFLRRKDSLEVLVADNGRGIKREEQKRIFDNLYRISQGDKHDVKGFGIGLYYTKRIMEEHGGEVRLVNSDQNGSVFGLRFKKDEL